ncbi:MAG: hypothetical protein HFE64_04655 [Lachnospiraceae bacterium]|jgi:hypothetical protein|nr:hypothetical protein [Lachnospiraceae bacterium]
MMNCVFKGFFNDPDSAEAAYYALRSKQLVNDLETSNLATPRFTSMAPQIAYSAEGNTMINSSVEHAGLFNNFLTNNDPRVAMTPFLQASEREKEASSKADTSFYLYGHCRRKDLDAVSACLRNFGAYSVLSSGVERPSRFQH